MALHKIGLQCNTKSIHTLLLLAMQLLLVPTNLAVVPRSLPSSRGNRGYIVQFARYSDWYYGEGGKCELGPKKTSWS